MVDGSADLPTHLVPLANLAAKDITQHVSSMLVKAVFSADEMVNFQ